MLTSRRAFVGPSQCALCRGWSTARVCDGCAATQRAVVARCRRCAIEVPPGQPACGACLLDPPPQAVTVAAVDYLWPWDHLIGQFKFHAALDLCEVLVDRIATAVRREGAPVPDLLIAAPLAPRRLRERGYNQSAVLARPLARRFGVAPDPHALVRLRETAAQADLPRAERIANVRGAYAVDPLRRGRIAGRHVGVVDDVLTTGATAAEMARTLLWAGAAQVSVWVVARTTAPGRH